MDRLIKENYNMHIETKQYTEIKSLNTFNNRIAYDNVTEYILIDTKSYTQEQFEQILKNAHKTICGFVRYIKKRLIYGNGRIEYKHICQCLEF